MIIVMAHKTPREKALAALAALAAIVTIVTGVMVGYTFVSGNKDLPEAISGSDKHDDARATIVKQAIAAHADTSMEEDSVGRAENSEPPPVDSSGPPDLPWCQVVLEEWPDDIDCAKAAFMSTAGACNVPLSAMPSMYPACTRTEEIEGKCTRATAVPFHEDEMSTSAVAIASWCEQLRNRNVQG